MASEPEGTPISVASIAAMIDHSLLRPDMTVADVVAGCAVAARYQTRSCCVRPCDVPLAVGELKGSGVGVSAVVSFPHGAGTTDAKVFEAGRAIDDGCLDLDMVISIGRLLSGDYDYVERDVAAVVREAHGRGATVKVIFENFFLKPEQIVTACRLCESAGADFVKTSTGYAGGGAKLEDVALMRRSTKPTTGVKAAGGIRSLDALLQFRAAGAGVIGATATKDMVEAAIARVAAGDLRAAAPIR
ncbi:MAG: deoxyribose-phosphate aldolase [Anaerolineae bacterium]